MPFEKRAGLTGKVYIPPMAADRKHACPDCFSCQMCSDDRCAVCRKEGGPRRGGDCAGGPMAGKEGCRCRAE